MPTNDAPNDVILWFKQTEDMLADFLEIVPCEKGHEAVWSPRLVSVGKVPFLPFELEKGRLE